jgi:23S rRNA-/tRNA-specific pseudouridylate synthase
LDKIPPASEVGALLTGRNCQIRVHMKKTAPHRLGKCHYTKVDEKVKIMKDKKEKSMCQLNHENH